MPKKKVYVVTIRVAIDADACGSAAGASDWFSGLLSDHEDVLDWAYGCKHAKGFPGPTAIEVPADYEEGDFIDKKCIKELPVEEDSVFVPENRPTKWIN